MAKVKKIVKTIKVDADRCNGCRGCEIACSAFHAEPKYSSINPARSRIRILTHRLQDIWLPIFAGEYTPTECAGREVYTIDGKEYDECGFCRAACPSRDMFKEPDTGLPLRCDMCEGEEEPWCVKWCLNDVLVYEEREEWVEEETVDEQQEQLDTGLESLADKYGLEKLRAALDRLTIKED
jgi:benzoyl-CoA reductase subunit BamC